ncbi:dual specificity mitogen-activated protein kinase kinase 6-like [Panonychus citri]|uniref:dual specificity mitogen-activated protein kinase kinase 6-like n=1 Tax=Panonychus citri TaxID=50023 RepID=UPI0023070AA0|nr:dual specificity mitogen-activated protein kinase kinase 6-like [Panonychus citri]
MGDNLPPISDSPRSSKGLASRRKGPSLKTGFTSIEQQVDTPREAIAANTVNKSTKITIDGQTISVDPSDIEVVRQLGKGAYGIVEQVRHKPSSIEMAVKRTAVSQEQKRFLMDMDVLDKADDCLYIVKFYGALFWEGDLWIFMEIMDSSLDKFYRQAYEKCRREISTTTSSSSSPLSSSAVTTSTSTKQPTNSTSDSSFLSSSSSSSPPPPIPENVLGKMAYCIVKALHHLHGIQIIHRDVKPSNVLINRLGQVKLCDFGISGPLVNSVAKTMEVGCKPYMAPERINPPSNTSGYDIRSDVWSLGMSMLELAIGQFPYHFDRNNFFNLLKKICTEEPPKLPPNRYSLDCEDFIHKCLQKNYKERPSYAMLLEHRFLIKHMNEDISDYVSSVID